MQLILGPARLTNSQETCCFFCRQTFTITNGAPIVAVEVDGDSRKHLKDHHACPACANLDDKPLMGKLIKAAHAHRMKAKDLRAQAEAEEAIADAYDEVDPQKIERTWKPGVF